MGTTNQPSNLINRVIRLERKVADIWKKVGLTSAIIRKGGLTLIQDAFIRMVDDRGYEIVYFGPDAKGRQIIRIAREGGADVMWTGFSISGNQFWRLTDRTNRELFSDDAENGGMARPWLSVPMYPKFSPPADQVFVYRNLPVGGEQTLWEGRIPLVTHPRIAIGGIWGDATGTGTNTSSYRLLLNGAEVGSWGATVLENSTRGPFPIQDHLDRRDVMVELRASGSGTGRIACQVYGCYLRQT